ncbi:MAG: UDP-N-acetylmuramate dehydrogenase [Alteromonadaceae bacterium]|nr:UDP-N-acetylmuramate dehydrogenase [Alteromonadaceae bacterium]
MHSLKTLNSFNFNAHCKEIYEVGNTSQLSTLPKYDSNMLILGEGTNIAFTSDFEGTVVRFRSSSLSIVETDSTFQVKVDAGHNWHVLVDLLVKQGMPGVENLALIPGTVGAAPVQNIGAYGVEFSDVCDFVEFYDLTNHKLHRINKQECLFGYRDSIFKHKGNEALLITSVGLTLSKIWQPNTSYKGLDELGQSCTPNEVLNRVIEIRQSKLPDPKVIGNAGSFFKNPVVSKKQYQLLKREFHDLPAYPVGDDNLKVPAAFLIEQCGFKGHSKDGIGAFEKQPLVLVNRGDGNGAALLDFARNIQTKVLEKFDIKLQNEVRLIGKDGEITL